MKTYILHVFTICGGGEKVSLEIASVLRERGFDVTYVTNSEVVLKKCTEMFQLPGDYDVIKVRSFLEEILSNINIFIRYRKLLLFSKVFEKTLSLEEGLIIDSGVNVPLAVDISYIHYPTVFSSKNVGLNPFQRLYNWLVLRKAQSIIGYPKLVFTNSSWTARLIRETYGLNAEILYPPVDIEYFAYDGRVKEKIIATVSRFMPGKNLHLLPRVASKLDYEWYLIGSTGISKSEKRLSNKVLEMIENEKSKHRALNFHVLTNISSRELREILQNALFYVHPFYAEHFGIAVVEAMSSGAIPIVFKDGGAWTDIVSNISRELGYTEIEEIPVIIRKLEDNSEKLIKLREKVVEKSMEFKRGVFREKFIFFIEKLLNQ